MRTSTRRFLSIVFATALTAAAIFVYGLFISPAIDDISAARADLKQKQDLLDTQTKAVEKIESLFSGGQGEPALQRTIDLALPVSDPQVASIVFQLNGLATISSVQINQISTQLGSIQPAPKDALYTAGVGSVKISFDVQGSYEAVQQFLGTLETNVRIMDVTQLNLDEGVVDQNILSAKVTIDAYYQSRSQQQPQPQSSAATTTKTL